MERINEDHILALKRKIKTTNEQSRAEDFRRRLENIISTKIKTAFIGALDVFEKTFGELWGYNSEESLSEDQQAMLTLWMKARNDILNNGNNQIRAMKAELENHSVHWNRYQMKLPVKSVNETPVFRKVQK